MNRGVEIDPALADGERSVILDQVEAGVAVRMAVLYLLAKEVGAKTAGTSGARCRLQTGLDRVAAGDPDALRLLRGKKLGLLAHPASVDRNLRHAHAVLLRAGCDVRALFGPEHGYGGEAQDMIAVELRARSRAACPCTRCTARAKKISSRSRSGSPASMPWSSICRTSAAATTRSCGPRRCMLRRTAPRGIELIVLDRPNPLGGAIVEGGPQRSGYRSFVGLYDVAVRHGMTLAELCRLACERDRARSRDAHAWCRCAAGVASMTFDRDRAAVGAAVAEHADARHRARVSRAVV